MSPLFKNTYREILRSPGRFLAILAIIVLGSGFFVGLRVSQKAMTATADTYLDKTRFYDFSAANTLGLTQEDVEAMAADPAVLDAEGSFQVDALVNFGENIDSVYAFYTLPERINVPELLEGRLPESPNECLADSWSGKKPGDKIYLSPANDQDTLELFTVRELTVTGVCTSPLYLNFERGSTSLGSGSVAAFCYVTPEAIDADYYTAVYLRCPDMPEAYTDAYDRRSEALEEPLTALAEARAQARYDSVIADAQAQLQDAEQEYEDGLADYRRERADAERELEDARLELENAKKELEDGERDYEQGLRDYEDGQARYQDALRDFADAQAQLQDGEAQYQEGLQEYNDGLEAYNAGAALLAGQQAEYDQNRAAFDVTAQGALEQLAAGGFSYGSIEELAAAVEAMPVLGTLPGVGDLLDAYGQLNAAGAELADASARLAGTKAALDEAQATLMDTRAQLDAGQRELVDAERQLDDTARTLDEARTELEDARAELDQGHIDYDDGLAEYEDAKAEAEREFADAEAELADAEKELEDARREIDDIAYPDTYLLGRWANVGYACFESDASIVRSISAVFPVFFFLVAALICITTVSRMVEEQRSQLGVLMALGYSRFKVMGKFLSYAGLATVVGCVSGILLGSRVIPLVVWQAYKIMYSFSDNIEFFFDLKLSGVTFLLYLASMLAVTWLSCRKELSDVPANVIRPKAPKAGKRVVLERVPFIWNRLSFLWKVTVRNIFRYKSRVFMMILGIAGCTALMMTGMGINDSIRNVVDYQFTEISLYDFTVTFSGHLDKAQQEAFLEDAGDMAADALFLHQSSYTASANRAEKEVYLNAVASDSLDRVGEFMDFHRGGTPLPFPGQGEALINNGLAGALGVKVGDTLELRDDDASMTLTVSGIYDNYIYNNIYISSDTYEAFTGGQPDINYALVLKGDGVATGEALAAILGMDDVLTASASQELRTRIGNMMESLIYIVLLTIVCAAALAFVVIYNLTNINIQERLRELATVKVLGFFDLESALYVLRENFLLTVLGAAAGVPLGLALNAYVMGQIKIDLIHFTPRVLPMSYVYSIALTFLFSVLVDGLMFLRLRKINPAEALKAAE